MQAGAAERRTRVLGERLEQATIAVGQLGGGTNDKAASVTPRNRKGPGRRDAGHRNWRTAHRASDLNVVWAEPETSLPDILPRIIEHDADGLAGDE